MNFTLSEITESQIATINIHILIAKIKQVQPANLVSLTNTIPAHKKGMKGKKRK